MIDRDSETVRALRMVQLRGDDADWRSLFDRVYPFVRARVWRYRVAGPCSSEDIVQDAAYELFTGLVEREFGSREEFWAFVDRVLSTKAARSVRRASTRKRDQDRVSDETLVEGLVDNRPSAEQISKVREQVDLIESAIAELPRRSARIMVMRTAGGMSFREIAEQLGMPSEVSVRVAFSRARKQVANRVDGIAETID